MSTDLQEKYSSALLYAGIGDALGWPMEFGAKGIDHPINNFKLWKKRIGGRWWGYEQVIKPGSYSDDMQLILSTARCINNKGYFEPEVFSYLELPLWLAYEQGGGRATKKAAHSLASGTPWDLNFYKSSQPEGHQINYVTSGGNGALMRIIPIVLANWHNSDKMLIEVWRNSIITHGHPRAIIGALAYAITAHIILEGVRNYSKIKSKILVFLSLENIQILFGKKFEFWLKEWDEKSDHLFLESWELAVNEIEIGLNHIPSSLRSDDIDFYKHLGAVSPQTRGSGIVSFIVCFYMFLKYSTDPYDGLIRMVNIKGSDTDTLASLTCVLWGLLHGTSALPSSFQQSLQDRDYIEKVSFDLLKIHQENYSKKIIRESFSKKDALLSALA